MKQNDLPCCPASSSCAALGITRLRRLRAPPPRGAARSGRRYGPAQLKRDSGTISHNFLSTPWRDVMRDGQKVTIFDGGEATLTGKRGTLTIRDRNEWVHLERDGNGDGENDAIAIGTWKVVRGTGQYAGIVGKGRNAHVGLGSPWYARYEGFLTRP